jgi:hypothetical protein
VAVQKPQCTHLRKMDSASRPSGVSRMKSASWVCTDGYTFCVKIFGWLIVTAAIALIGYAISRWRRRRQEHRRASAERFSAFIAQARGAVQAQKERLAKP